MNNFMDAYFGPLGKEYCTYFYVLAIISGVAFVLSAISVATFIITHHKQVNVMFVANSILILFNAFLAYLSNRLLNTMCVKTL